MNQIIHLSGATKEFDEVHDLALQKAIELSRNEAEMGKVIQESKQKDGRESIELNGDEYCDLQRAIDLSKNDILNCDESDLDMITAIKMSLQNQKDDPSTTTRKKQEVIDIEEKAQVSQELSHDVIEILDD